jgi:hypothetical protein
LNVSFFPFPNQLGGLNSLLASERNHSIPRVSRIPTIIFGMDVSHGPPGRAGVPSIAAVRTILLMFLVSAVRKVQVQLMVLDIFSRPQFIDAP